MPMAGADLDIVRQITMFLNDDDIYEQFCLAKQVHRMRTDATRVAVLEQGDGTQVRFGKECVEVFAGFYVFECGGQGLATSVRRDRWRLVAAIVIDAWKDFSICDRARHHDERQRQIDADAKH